MLEAQFPGLPGYAAAQVPCLYVSAFDVEIDTRPLLSRVLADGKRLVCPRVDRKARCLRLFAVSDLDRDLAPGALGILEPLPTLDPVDPAAVDWLLAPGLAFDADGYRLGRGAGYYDRLLPRLAPEAVVWALCFDIQRTGRLPREPHDQPLSGVTSSSGSFPGTRLRLPPSP